MPTKPKPTDAAEPKTNKRLIFSTCGNDLALKVGDFRLFELDDRNLMLERYSSVRGKGTAELYDSWQFEGYYNTVRGAIKHIVDHAARTSDAGHILKSIDGAVERICGAVTA